MSEISQVLVPIEERRVDFYGDTIIAALVPVNNQSEIYIPIRPVCAYLGLSWAGQRERINRDDVLAGAMRSVRVTRTEAGGKRDTLCLPLELLPGWLFGIDVSRVKPELREKLTRYRLECFKILWRAFQAGALAVAEQVARFEAPPIPNTGTTPSATLLQIRDMGLAIAQLAEQQMSLEQALDETSQLAVSAHERLDKAAQVVRELKQKLGAIEKKVSPQAYISDEQAAEIANHVKALADYLSSQDKTKNHYQSIFAELYRRFRVSSYKQIGITKFEAVMKFLEEWNTVLTTNTTAATPPPADANQEASE